MKNRTEGQLWLSIMIVLLFTSTCIKSQGSSCNDLTLKSDPTTGSFRLSLEDLDAAGSALTETESIVLSFGGNNYWFDFTQKFIKFDLKDISVPDLSTVGYSLWSEEKGGGVMHCFGSLTLQSADIFLIKSMGTNDDTLIIADFTNQIVTINGELLVNFGVSNKSNSQYKTVLGTVDGYKLVDDLINLPIYFWKYNKDNESRHIGPLAEDFYNTFHLGNNQNISTIDSDGIIIALLKQAFTEIGILRKENEDLKNRIMMKERKE